MKRSPGIPAVSLAALATSWLFLPSPASAATLAVEVWADHGNEAIYQPGDVLQVQTRASDDAYLLVYEIDSQGYVHVLFPIEGANTLVAAHETVGIPPENSPDALVVQDPTGQDFIVAIASREPFDNLPWYLRPFNAQGADVGYVNKPDDEQGITADGQIVGDPFVAMERIRRRVCKNPDDATAFATSYTTYYVHQQVRYPRYICADCHRPDQWSWWDGFDPYYSQCSVVDFRVNWSWGWGPAYWFGAVPYYVYVPRTTCPPRYRWSGNVWYSSWDGWNQWSRLWGGPLVRYKSPPPPGYVPPSDWRNQHGANQPPPGFVVAGVPRGRGLQLGHQNPSMQTREPRQGGTDGSPVTRLVSPHEPATRMPVARMPGTSPYRLPTGDVIGRGAREYRRPEVGRMPSRPAYTPTVNISRHTAPAPVPVQHEHVSPPAQSAPPAPAAASRPSRGGP
jgi:Domain of unknown function (DUF4384)